MTYILFDYFGRIKQKNTITNIDISNVTSNLLRIIEIDNDMDTQSIIAKLSIVDSETGDISWKVLNDVSIWHYLFSKNKTYL